MKDGSGKTAGSVSQYTLIGMQSPYRKKTQRVIRFTFATC